MAQARCDCTSSLLPSACNSLHDSWCARPPYPAPLYPTLSLAGATAVPHPLRSAWLLRAGCLTFSKGVPIASLIHLIEKGSPALPPKLNHQSPANGHDNADENDPRFQRNELYAAKPAYTILSSLPVCAGVESARCPLSLVFRSASSFRHYSLYETTAASVANVRRSKARSSNGVLSSVTILPIVVYNATLGYKAGHSAARVRSNNYTPSQVADACAPAPFAAAQRRVREKLRWPLQS
jgi:hypothetical protein